MKQYVVDAFTDKIFAGNPAAICVMENWISDELMQNIAMENNLSETAFAVKEKDKFNLRWFTPGGEIDLCGHATLATAFVIFSFVEKDLSTITFTTKSGDLVVNKQGDLLEMSFPKYELTKIDVTDDMEEAIGIRPIEAFMGRDLLCVLPTEDDVVKYTPNIDKVKLLDGLLLHTTAKGTKYDCVSRTYAPKLNVAEDPVCGSGHCHIVPYWAEKLGKNKLLAYQASDRSGVLYCEKKGDRIILAGNCALFSISEIFINE